MSVAENNNELSDDDIPSADSHNQTNSDSSAKTETESKTDSRDIEHATYEDDENGNKNRIFHWLSLDNWNLTEATLIVLDIDPERKVINKRNKFEYVMTFKGQAYPSLDSLDNAKTFMDESGILFIEGEAELLEYQRKYDDLRRTLLKPGMEDAKPSDWITRALNKHVDIPWIQLAIENGFFKPKRHYQNIKPLNAEAELLESERTSLLKIVLALAENTYHYPNRRGAIAEILRDFSINNNGVTENTLNKYLKMASQSLPSKPRQQ